ncbi:hypothetical protein ACFCWG_22290 [Streptomyces sp. NPDC056390]
MQYSLASPHSGQVFRACSAAAREAIWPEDRGRGGAAVAIS